VRVGENGRLEIAETASTPQEQIVVHDAHQEDPTLAFQLAHISTGPTQPTCIGVFRNTQRPVYGEAMEAQIEQATDRLGQGDLAKLLHSGDTWVVK
jgi:2-oxoglutarate ferredoxin oxidoreductase subunit beta